MSILGSLLTSVKTRIETIPSIPTVIARKRLIILTDDVLPIVLVAPTEGEAIKKEAFGKIFYEYPIGVCFVEAGNREYDTGLASSLDVREAIRNKLTGITLDGVPEVWDTDVSVGTPLMIPISGTGSNYQASNIRVKYTTSETRPNL